MAKIVILQRITHALGRVPANTGSGFLFGRPSSISPQPMSLQGWQGMAGPAYLKIWTTVLHNSKLLPMTLSERGLYLWLLVMCKEQRDDGQVWVRSWSALGSACACEGRTACKILGRLQESCLLSYTVDDRGTIAIEIPNYKEWQSLEVAEVLQKTRNNAHNVQSTSQNARQQSRAEQSKAEHLSSPKISGDQIPFEQIIKDLNRKAGRRFQWQSKAGKLAAFCDEIKARWAEGYELKDFLYVHTVMVYEWGEDEKMQRCLQPSTLYRKSKFPNYLGRPTTDGARLIQERITAEDQLIDKPFKWRQLNTADPKEVKAVRIRDRVWYQVEGTEVRQTPHTTFMATHESIANGRESGQTDS